MFPAILCAKTRISTNSNLCWPPKLSRRLTGEGLTVRGAHSRTGIAANDFSRIRNADLGRFTIDRLVSIVNRLGAAPELCVCDVQSNFDLSQPTISHHLGLLRKAGLVESDVRGRWAFYRAKRDAIKELGDVLEVGR